MRFPLLSLLFASVLVTAPLHAQQPPSGRLRHPFVIERQVETMRYQADGTGRKTLSVRVRIQNDAGVEQFGQLAFPYGSANQRLDVDTVLVRKPGGQVVVTPAASVQDVTSPIAREAPMFSDLRAKVVPVAGLRPGDTLEYHVTWTTHTALAPGYFWFAADFARDAIILDQRLVAIVPRQVAVQVRTTGTPEPTVTEDGDQRVYAWRHANAEIDTTLLDDPARQARRLRRQPRSVQMTSFRSWADVGRWYASLEREREAVTPMLKARADSLVRGRATLRDSIAALYDHVSQEFRYVSISFGLGRYQPHAAAEVLANQYGDCKDKHTLLAALLQAVGVPSAPVLVSSATPVDSALPSPHHFDHLITWVPAGRDTFWLDATPEVAPFGYLMSPLRDHLALVIPLDGAAGLRRTPARAPFDEHFTTEVEGRLSTDGALTSTVRQTFRGDVELVMRLVFRQVAPEQLRPFGTQLARQQGFGGTVTGLASSAPRATREPFSLTFQLDRAGAVTWSSARGILWLPRPALDLWPERDTAATPDTVELDLTEQRQTVRIELPPGASAQPPAPVTHRQDFGAYESRYRLEGSALIAQRSFRLTRRELPPDRARDLEALRRAVRDDEQQSVLIVRPAGAPPVAGTPTASQLFDAARAAVSTNDWRGAVRAYRRFLVLEPEHREAWNNLGRAFAASGRLDSAVVAFRRQIEVVPDHHLAHNNLGRTLWMLGRHAEAERAFRRQIEVSPLDRWAHANLGRMHLELGRDSAAAVALERAAAVTPDEAEVHYDLGRAYLRTGRPELAVASFDRAIALHPSAGSFNNVAYQLAERGAALDVAERYARQAVDSVYAVFQDLTLAEVGPREAFAVASLASYWDTLGWVYFRRDDLAAAERYVRAAWQLNQRAVHGDHLAQILERQGRREEALRTWALALNVRRDSAPGARGRLETLAGSRARANALIAAQRRGLQAMRTVRIPRALRARVTGQVRLLIGPDGVVEMSVPDGPEVLLRADSAIRAARFPIEFPDSTAARVPRSGLLSCETPSGDCTIVLFEEMVATFPMTEGFRPEDLPVPSRRP